MERSPSPGVDATPFLLRCFAKATPFRPVSDFGPDIRPMHEEYKLYVWKTTTLREIAQMLYEANPTLSQPLSLHAFRLVYFDSHRNAYVAREAGLGITRVALADIEDLLDGVDMSTSSRTGGFTMLKDEVDERAAKTTIGQLRLVNGDMLDCVVKSVPTAHGPPTGPAGFGPRTREFSGGDRHRGSANAAGGRWRQ